MDPLEELMIAAAAWLAANGDTVPIYGEPAELNAHHSPPRYVWFPDRDQEYGEGTRFTRSGDVPRAVGGWLEGFTVHCWGTSFSDARRLRNNMQAALHASSRECEAVLEFRDSGWLSPEATGRNLHGKVYVLNAVIATRVPATYDAGPDATVEYDDLAPEHSVILADLQGNEEPQ